MLRILFYLFILTSGLFYVGHSQQPKYTTKHFVNYQDTIEFKVVYPASDGLISTYILTEVEIWDVDDENKTHVRGSGPWLLHINGPLVKNQRHGLFTTYVIDSADHSKEYKIYEQDYKNDRLTGEWRVYNLKGTLVRMDSYKNDSISGISRTYWIDGKRIMEEREFLNGQKHFIERGYIKNNQLQFESSVMNNKMNGLTKEYYDEDGSLKREMFFTDDVMNGSFKYYYPGGKLWIETEYKNGKPWNVLGNYDKNGKPREKGTLKNGNGTILLYNDDNTLRKVETYVNGELKDK